MREWAVPLICPGRSLSEEWKRTEHPSLTRRTVLYIKKSPFLPLLDEFPHPWRLRISQVFLRARQIQISNRKSKSGAVEKTNGAGSQSEPVLAQSHVSSQGAGWNRLPRVRGFFRVSGKLSLTLKLQDCLYKPWNQKMLQWYFPFKLCGLCCAVLVVKPLFMMIKFCKEFA
jgi:hypothetical protein